jgi:hypothetical protein
MLSRAFLAKQKSIRDLASEVQLTISDADVDE